MSLQFSQDPLSKREKQELFKQSLDDQRRLKQEGMRQEQASLASRKRHPDEGQFVPGLDGLSPGMSRIPGLDHYHDGGGSAPRFEGSASPPQEKQPYMSALSEMNGRPLHVRQQQFEKESRYRNMLRDQIEENKKRKVISDTMVEENKRGISDQIEENRKKKGDVRSRRPQTGRSETQQKQDVERAKRDEEKRKELEELQRMQGRPAPRRQQHAQFQESPDHPLPSPGRVPPAAQSDQRRKSTPQGYDWEERAARTQHGPAPGAAHRSRGPHGVGGPGSEGGWQGQQRMPDGTPGREALGQDHRPRVQLDTGASAAFNDAGGGRRDLAEHAHNGAPSSHGGYGGGGFDGSTGRSNYQHGAGLPQGQEGTARTLAFERGGARQQEGPQDGRNVAPQDVVPRRDFDELSSLCRELLLEQKRLRSKLEEREEREQLAEQARQQEPDRRQPQGRQPRETLRGGRGASKLGGAAATGGGRRPRGSQVPSLAFPGQGNSARDSAVRHDSKAKPSVAFGSTVSRLEKTRPVEKPRSAAGGSNTASRGRRVPRISKSEPTPRAEHLSVPNNSNRGAAPAEGADIGRRRPHHQLPDIGWAGTNNDTASGRSGVPDRALGNRAPPEESNAVNRSGYPSSNDHSGTVHDLLRRAQDPRVSGRDAHPRVSGRDADPRFSGRDADPRFSGRDADLRGSGREVGAGQGNSRDGYGELGGESMFLAAHPPRSGGEDGAVNGRDSALLDPRLAADPWNQRR